MAYPTAPGIPGPRGNRGGGRQPGGNFLAYAGQGIGILNALTQYGQGQEDREFVIQKRQDRKNFMARVSEAERLPSGDFSEAFKSSMYQQNPELAPAYFKAISLSLQEDAKFDAASMANDVNQTRADVVGLTRVKEQLAEINAAYYQGIQSGPGDPQSTEFGTQFGGTTGSEQAGREAANKLYQAYRPQMEAFFGNGKSEMLFNMPLEEMLVPSYNPEGFAGAERLIMKNIAGAKAKLSTMETLIPRDPSTMPKAPTGFAFVSPEPGADTGGIPTVAPLKGYFEAKADAPITKPEQARLAATELERKKDRRVSLRAEYEKGEGVKSYQDARGLLRLGMNTDPTGPGDQVMVKAMVRFGEIGGRASIITAAEFGIAKGAGGWQLWGEGMLKQMTGEGELATALRAQMKHQMGLIYLSLGEEQKAWEARYTDLAKKAGFKDTSRIVRKMYGTEGEGFITPAALEVKMAEWKTASKVLGKGAEIIKADRDPATIPADELLEGRTYIYEGKKARWTGTTWEKAL